MENQLYITPTDLDAYLVDLCGLGKAATEVLWYAIHRLDARCFQVCYRDKIILAAEIKCKGDADLIARPHRTPQAHQYRAGAEGADSSR